MKSKRACAASMLLSSNEHNTGTRLLGVNERLSQSFASANEAGGPLPQFDFREVRAQLDEFHQGEVMTMRFLRTVIAVAFTAIAFALPCATQANPEQPQIVTTVIQIKLTTDKSQYRVGEPILLRSTIYNSSNFTYSVHSGFATQLVALTVRDAAGNVVKPDGYSRTQTFASMPVGVDLPGGAPRTIPSFDREDWVRLADWGYVSLPPGRYSVSGVLSTEVIRTTGEDQDAKVVEHFFTGDKNGKGAMGTVSFDIVP
jgi:hypothetical protein